jgi:hypothetical protein
VFEGFAYFLFVEVRTAGSLQLGFAFAVCSFGFFPDIDKLLALLKV